MKAGFIIVFFCSVCACLICGCTTTASFDSYNSGIEKLGFFRVDLASVSLIVDQVQEKHAVEQIYGMSKTILNRQNSFDVPFDTRTTLDIKIIQRSFIKGIEPLNSIFISCTVSLEDGTVCITENSYLSGTMTMLSAADQYKYISKCIQKIQKLQKNTYDKKKATQKKIEKAGK